ncbi:acyl-CoA thioesterase [Mesorhizobium atlanticum]
MVRRMEIDFRSPARMDDILTIDTRTDDISGARIFMGQQLKRGGDVAGRGKGRSGDRRQSGRPKRFPKEWIAAFMPKTTA